LLWKLRDLRRKSPTRDQLLLRLGAARKEAGRAFGFVRILLPKEGEAVTRQTFTFQLAVVYCGCAKKSGMWLNSHGVAMSGLYYPRGVLPNCCKPRVSTRPFCMRLWVETTVAVR
jgi:hypothetical protein